MLAEHPTRRGPDGRPLPVILQRRAGAGMVLFHATDETWRWRYQVGDVFFARYWIQTIRYLSRTKLLGKDQVARLSTNRKQYAQGEPVRLRLEFTDPRLSPADGRDVTMLLRHGDQAERQLKLTRSPTNHELFEATLDPLAPRQLSGVGGRSAAAGRAVGQFSGEGVGSRIRAHADGCGRIARRRRQDERPLLHLANRRHAVGRPARRPACADEADQPADGTLEPLARLTVVAAAARRRMDASETERNDIIRGDVTSTGVRRMRDELE